TRTTVEVEDGEIDEEIAKMADRNSRLVDIDDREARDGDTANIDFEGFVDGVAFAGGKGNSYDLVLGSGQFIPGFEGQIVGKKIGEAFDVNVTFPEEYQAEELKGKEAIFKVTLNSLKFKEIPEIDDEFAKDVSEFDTLELLREDIKAKMTEHKQKVSDEELENSLCDAAAAKMTAVIPQAMIDRKMDEMVQDFGYRLQSQGMKLEDYIKYTGSDMEAFRKNFAPQAEQQVKVTLTLEKIAELEGLAPTAEDIAAEYEKT
ncbi:MAG: trigger factor, partial [Angelakisella sp.]